MEFEIFWAESAEMQLQETLSYWVNRNKSDNYPRKLLDAVKKANITISKNPFIAQERTIKGVSYRSYLVVKQYSLIYIVEDKSVKIVMFWNNAKDPR